jgi:RNA polymerase sigma-70 factor (ECF subfamily)
MSAIVFSAAMPFLGGIEMPGRTKPPPRAAAQPATSELSPLKASKAGADPLAPLLPRLAAREQAALAALYDATVNRAYAVALRIVRRDDAAEEVVEDAFMQVWNTADRFDASRGSVLAWLLVITRSRALDYLRRQDSPEIGVAPEELAETSIAAADDPLDLLAATEVKGRIHKALAALPALERQLVSLAFLRGLTHQEIADATRLPLGTVKTHIRRALIALREDLELKAVA